MNVYPGSLFNSIELLSKGSYLPCQTPHKVVISNFYDRRSDLVISNSIPFDPELNASTTRIHYSDSPLRVKQKHLQH